MNDFLSLLVGAVKSDVSSTVRRTKRQAILYGIFGLFALTTYVLGVAALIIYAATHFGAFEAVLAGTAVSAATSLLVLAAIAILNHRDKKHRRSAAHNTMAVAKFGADSVSSAAGHMSLKKLLLVAAASFAATKISQSRK